VIGCSVISMVIIFRTNCSINDEQCWQQALIYRSAELVDRLFQFSSLSVYLNSFQSFHPNSSNVSVSFQ